MNNNNENTILNKPDVSSSIFFSMPLITYEKTELKLSKEEIEEFKTQTFTTDRAFFIWNKLPKDTRPELEFFMEWFYDDIHFTYGCPQCGSKNYKEEGNNHHQTDDEMEYLEYYKCRNCGHRFVI